MLVEVDSKIQAQRLTNNGYTRTGEKAIEAELSQVGDIFDQDDVDVTKISLHRNNGPAEAEIIDREIDCGHEGRVKYLTGARNCHTAKGSVRTSTSTLFKVTADSMTIRTDYQDVLDGDYQRVKMSPEEYNEARGELVDRKRAKAEELRETADEYVAESDQLEAQTFDDWLDSHGYE